MFTVESSPALSDLPVFGAFAANLNGINGHSVGADRPTPHTCAPTADLAAERELVDLRRKVATLPVIEQAKGMLMSYYGISADIAFDVLRRWSMSNNVKLSEVCATLVAEAGRPSELPFGSLRDALTRWETAS